VKFANSLLQKPANFSGAFFWRIFWRQLKGFAPISARVIEAPN
jgi:hypothetical protein